MTRYEFEVLSHLERNGAGQYPLRTLSDALTISGGEISRCLEQLAAKHWITQDGDTLAVTDAGLAALEPYRVKRAIILAAGFGSRMMTATADRPKPLVTVNGVRILETLLDALVAVGIRDITVVRGYRKECFDALLEKYVVAKLSEEAMTALALVYPVQNLITSIAVGFGIGINACVAFYLGADDKLKADNAASSGVFLSIIHGILLMIFCIGGMPLFVRMFSSDEVVIGMALAYSRRA